MVFYPVMDKRLFIDFFNELLNNGFWCYQSDNAEVSYFGEINSNFQIGDDYKFISPSSPPKKSSRFLGPKKFSEEFFRKPRQTPHVRNLLWISEHYQKFSEKFLKL